MKVEKLIIGQLQTNCYLLWDKKSHKAIIIDPGDDSDYIISKVQNLKLNPIAIIATHGHFDHVLGSLEVKLIFNIPFLLNSKDLFLLSQAQKSAQFFLKIFSDPPAAPDYFLKDGDFITFGSNQLKILETPGHTPGSICLVSENVLFCGDLVFADGFGRTDFSYSSKMDFEKSLNKILKLPENTLVFPGHGEETIIKKIRTKINNI